MRVTALKAQSRNPDRISIYVDGEWALSLDSNQLLDEKLHLGLEIEKNRLDELKKISQDGKVYDRIFRYVLLRPHSLLEVNSYAKRKKFDVEASHKAIESLQAKGYINDETFTKSWIENRHLHKQISLKRMKMELRQKGIDEATILKIIAESEFDEQASLSASITKKRRIPKYKDDKKLIQYLLSQGFDYDRIKQSMPGIEDE